MSLNSSMIENRYSDPLPCRSCKYALAPVGKYSRCESAYCKKYKDQKNPKPYGVLFANEECEFYEDDDEDSEKGSSSNHDTRNDADDEDWLTINGTRNDADDTGPSSWITLENGEHVPLDASGKAMGGAGGWAEGKDFSGANNKKTGFKNSEWKAKNDAARAEHKAMPDSKKALKLNKLWHVEHRDPKYMEIYEAFKNGTIDEKVDEWYDILEENGDPTPTKKTVSKQRELYDTVNSKYNGDWEAARIDAIIEDTGFTREEAEKTNKEIATWVSQRWHYADTATLDHYIENAPAYDGVIYRGMCFIGRHESTYDSFMEDVKSGVLRMNGNSSWSSDRDTARRFSHTSVDDIDSVIIKCVANKTATPIEHMARNNGGEYEVLAHSKTAWTVLEVNEMVKRDGGRHAEVIVMERGEYEDA